MRRSQALAGAVSLVICAADVADAKPSRVQLTGRVNLNTATVTQLDLLPGVGPKAAAAIVAHRQKQPFARIEELVKVKGFGKKRFDTLKAHLAVQGPTTLARHRGKVLELAPQS